MITTALIFPLKEMIKTGFRNLPVNKLPIAILIKATIKASLSPYHFNARIVVTLASPNFIHGKGVGMNDSRVNRIEPIEMMTVS